MKNGFDFPFVITVFLYDHSQNFRSHHFRPNWRQDDEWATELLGAVTDTRSYDLGQV